MGMNLPLLVSPIPLLSHFMSLATMESLTTKYKFKTSLIKVFIGLKRYFKLVARLRSRAAFTMLGPMSLVSLGMVMEGLFLISNHSFIVFLLLLVLGNQKVLAGLVQAQYGLCHFFNFILLVAQRPSSRPCSWSCTGWSWKSGKFSNVWSFVPKSHPKGHTSDTTQICGHLIAQKMPRKKTDSHHFSYTLYIVKLREGVSLKHFQNLLLGA